MWLIQINAAHAAPPQGARDAGIGWGWHWLGMRNRERDMEDVSNFIVGGLVVVLGLVGLVLASGALDIEMSVFGFSLAGFAVFFNFMLVKQHYDRLDAQRAAARSGQRHD